MPKSKGWKRGAVKKGNQRASTEVSKGKYDFDLCSTDNDISRDVTEELASLKTENSDISSDVTEELASLKTENKDIVQDSVNLVTQKKFESYLPANYLYNGQSEKRHSVQLVSHSNQREDFSSVKEPRRIFGNFHQNDRRFSDQTRGFQCTCNALCMLSYNTACPEIKDSSSLDKILCEGDRLYLDVTSNLKEQLRFIHPLLSLDELPDDFEIEIGKFTLEKDLVVSGFLVDTQENSELPSLHSALQSNLSSSRSCLLTIGAVCSAVFKSNDLYMFFDSHSHGENGLSSVDGRSILIAFSSLDDLVGYMYAFYDSMRIDMSLQFDLLPVRIRKHTSKQDCAGQNLGTMETPEGAAESIPVECIAGFVPKVTEKSIYITHFQDKSHAESFADCDTKDAEYFAKVFSMEAALFCKHSANKAFKFHKDFDDTFEMAFIDTSKTLSRAEDKPCENADVDLADAESEVVDRNVLKQFPTVKKRKNRTEYNKMYKKKRRLDPVYKAFELIQHDESKRKARQDPLFKANECAIKQNERQDAAFKANEINYQVKSKRKARQDPLCKANERTIKQTERQNAAFKANEINYQVKSKRKARQDPLFKANERTIKQTERQDAAFKANEINYQGESKRKARQNSTFKAKEINYQDKSKRKARDNPSFKAKEINYQDK